MIASTYKREQATIYVHDDYCKNVKDDTVPTILNEISIIISCSLAKNNLQSEKQDQLN